MSDIVYARDDRNNWHVMPEGEYSDMLRVARVLQRKGYAWAVGLSGIPLMFAKDLLQIGELARQRWYDSRKGLIDRRLVYHAPIELHIEALEFLGTHGREWDMRRMRPVLFKVMGDDRDRRVGLHGFNEYGGTELLVKGNPPSYTLDWHGSPLSECHSGLQYVGGATRYNFAGVVQAARKAHSIMYVRDEQPEEVAR